MLAEVTPEASALIAAGAALLGALLGSIGTYWAERAHRVRERHGLVYADAVATLGTKLDEFRKLATPGEKVSDSMSDYDLHHVYTRLKIDGTKNAREAYADAIAAAVRFIAASAARSWDSTFDPESGLASPKEERSGRRPRYSAPSTPSRPPPWSLSTERLPT